MTKGRRGQFSPAFFLTCWESSAFDGTGGMGGGMYKEAVSATKINGQ
jgi:hypothetical protein